MASNSAAPTLLYVEDEPITQDLVEAALRDAGFEVLIASDGVEALAQLGGNSGTLRGLITDVNLGDGPDGWEIARNARQSICGLPVVYVSGACEHEWTAKGVPHSLMIGPRRSAISSLLVAADSTPGEAFLKWSPRFRCRRRASTRN